MTRLVANNELNRADTHLTAIAGVAKARYAIQVSDLRVAAARKATDEYIQGLLINDQRLRMRRYVQTYPLTAFRIDGQTIGGDYKEPVVLGEAQVGSAKNVLILARPVAAFYKKVVNPPLGTSDERLVLLVGGAVVAGSPSGHIAAAPTKPGDVTVGETEYRAVAIRLGPAAGGAGITAVALRSRHSIDSASSDAWKWAIAAALVTLGTVALLAFLVAPAVAGRRWVRRLMPWELEEQYAVEAEPAGAVAAPVTSHGAAPTGAGNGAAAATARSAGRRVVVIDDDPDERSLFVDVLGPDGVDVATTGDAEHGLGLLDARQADLAILDWKMSGRSGAEILAEVNIRHPDVPVLVVADELEPQQRHVATLLGAEDFLIRPLESETVAVKATQLLETPRSDRVPS